MIFLTLILSLPTENATLRMRSWRTLKSAGAAALRDGVYLLPERDDCRATLEGVADEVNAGNGSAYLLAVEAPEEQFRNLFDRSADYEVVAADVALALSELTKDTVSESLKAARRLRKTLASIVAIDYFPGEAQGQADRALQTLEQKIAQTLSPDEPRFIDRAIEHLDIAGYQGRTWATRRRPWVDRLASAWLIQRFIDREATMLWLATPSDCPSDALGFDFDGATFTHVGGLVTFEVLIESFGLDDAALRRIGGLVHFLDVGGLQPSEASGVESILKGMRDALSDDDELLRVASTVFDGLLASFTRRDPRV